MSTPRKTVQARRMVEVIDGPAASPFVEVTPSDLDARRLYAIGYKGIAELAGCTEEAARTAFCRGQLDPCNPLTTADWIRKIRAGLARKAAREAKLAARGGGQP